MQDRGFLILKELQSLLLRTNSKWSHEQKQCCAHEVLKSILSLHV